MIELAVTFYMWTWLADHYLLFDFPGQVELFTLHSNAKNVILEMANKWDYRVRFYICTLKEDFFTRACESYAGHDRASTTVYADYYEQ
jgi:hypothetical protein